MYHNIRHVRTLAAMAALVLATTGCSIFVSTPKVARIQMHQLDNKLIEYVINLEDPVESNLGIRLSDNYALQLDFRWLWYVNGLAEAPLEVDTRDEESHLTPWMLCEYRF